MKHCRQKDDDPEVSIFNSATDLPADWDQHLPEKSFLKVEVVKAHEEANLPHMKHVYAGIRRDGRWIAQASFQVLTIQPNHLNPQRFKRLAASVVDTILKNHKPKLLVAGQLFRHDVQSFYWQRDLDPFAAFQYLRKTIDAASKTCGVQAVLVKETPAAFVPYFLHYAPEYLMLRNDSSMQLRLAKDWLSMADYEKASSTNMHNASVKYG